MLDAVDFQLQFAFVLPTSDCNARCAHCFYEVGHSQRVEAVDFHEQLDEALDEMAEDGLQQVIISGGEPLLAPRLLDLVELCAAKVMHILLLTRGEGLDADRLEQLEQAGLDDITLSAASPTPALRQVVNSILFHSRYVPNLLTCLTRQNVDQVGELLAMSAKLNLPHLFTPAFIPRQSPSFERLSLYGLSELQWDQLMEVLEPWAEGAGTGDYTRLVRQYYAGTRMHPAYCPMGQAGLVIEPDGSVYPCFHRHDVPLGNLMTDRWPEIRQRMIAAAPDTTSAGCFGEHCLSMFVGVREVQVEQLGTQDPIQ